MPKTEIRIEGQEAEARLDVVLSRRLGHDLSRSRLKQMIQAGRVLVNDRTVKPHYVVKPGDHVVVDLVEPEPSVAREEEIPLRVVYEDSEILVVDKPAGMVVHPACGNLEHTLVNALLYHTRRGLSSAGGSVRPGIVHRLDKDTSGLLVVAKNDRAHRFLARQFKSHSVLRSYEGVVKGVVQHDELRCDEPVGRSFLNRKKVIVRPSGGKDASTYFRVLQRFRVTTRIEARPETGRTHQIRVHLSYLGHPLLGDTLYGGASPLISRHALHARLLELVHPLTKKRMRFESPLPEDMEHLLMALKK